MGLYSGRVYRVAYGITRNAADAEEIVQDVFLSLWKNASQYESPQSVSWYAM